MSPRLPWMKSRWWQAVSWTGWLVAFGIGLRCYHYFRNPSMWHDEAALIINVLNKGFTSLLGPLFFAEAAPPLFLWVEKAVSLVLGDGTYALRLVPLLASCGSLILLVPVARRLLSPQAVPWAVLLFACSDNLLWHSCEAKPYAVEVFCALLLLAVYCHIESWPLGSQFVVYLLLAPVVIFVAFPGCFLCGGLLVALLPGVWRSRRPRAWLGYGLLVLVIGVSFTVLLLGPIHAQRCGEMTSCWLDHFPPLDSPWKVPVWVVASTCEIGRYCCRPIGQVLLVLAGVGTVLLWRRGRRATLLLLTLPPALALFASFLGAYPYGGTRVLVYAAPGIILLMAEGIPPAWNWLQARGRLGVAALVSLLLVPPLYSAYHVVVPWQRADCSGASAYVLAHRRSSDAVAGNHWEYLYYFRNLGPCLRSLRELPQEPGARLWFVASGENAQHRAELAKCLPPGDWQALEHKDFVRTTVFLLRRPIH